MIINYLLFNMSFCYMKAHCFVLQEDTCIPIRDVQQSTAYMCPPPYSIFHYFEENIGEKSSSYSIFHYFQGVHICGTLLYIFKYFQNIFSIFWKYFQYIKDKNRIYVNISKTYFKIYCIYVKYIINTFDSGQIQNVRETSEWEPLTKSWSERICL